MALYYVPCVLAHVQGIACWRDDTLHLKPLSSKRMREAKEEVKDIYEKEKIDNLKFKQDVIGFLSENQGWDEETVKKLISMYPKEPNILSMDSPKKYKLDFQGGNNWKKEESPRFVVVGN